MAAEVVLNTPLADALSEVVQPKLVEIGWTTDGLDDSALAEYIILMLVNRKTQDQISAELSNDLLNLGPDDSGAVDFSRWLFEQYHTIKARLEGKPVAEANNQQVQAIPSFSSQEQDRTSRRGSRQSGSAESPDTEMGETMDGAQNASMYDNHPGVDRDVLADLSPLRPTGPKAMRNGRQNNSNNRLIGQISKAMDRSNEAPLHHVRSQNGMGRINMHGRQTPTGPRGDPRRQSTQSNGRPMGSAPPMPYSGPAAAIAQMPADQQMKLLQALEQQAAMMSAILAPHQQQIFGGGFNAPAINPNFRNGPSQMQQQPGRSLFDRVEQRTNGNFNKQPQTNGTTHHTNVHKDAEMGESEPSSSMEVESSQHTHEMSPDTVCKFNLTCQKPECKFAHQSPAAPPGTSIDVSDVCPFGAACRNRKCVGRHPSPSQKPGGFKPSFPTSMATQDCKYFPNCTNAACPFRHPATTMPMCRNGANCTTPGCLFTHIKIGCRFNPCTNSKCPYKHEEGQQKLFGDRVWRADGQEKEHVSERKFVGADGGDEELIVPGTHIEEVQSSPAEQDLIT
ncbi:MAG: hypothetical protein MMC33_007445 [Icmadophila ericetorum]|nr:hypothetical protein [Icmadophila ericetorum]